MKIQFNKVLPEPLKEYKHSKESVWNNTFEIPKNQKVMLNASSGKGKTTFMGILYGVRKDYEGTVKIDGQDIRSFNLEYWCSLRKDQLSVVFQDLQLFSELTVIENLRLKNDLTQHKSQKEIKEMLRRLGIGDKIDKKCGLLSMGQKQRVAIIRSLLQPFQWLFMDEPFSHLDEENTRIGLELMNEETDKQNAGFILTSLGSSHAFEYHQELKI